MKFGDQAKAPGLAQSTFGDILDLNILADFLRNVLCNRLVAKVYFAVIVIAYLVKI